MLGRIPLASHPRRTHVRDWPSVNDTSSSPADRELRPQGRDHVEIPQDCSDVRRGRRDRRARIQHRSVGIRLAGQQRRVLVYPERHRTHRREYHRREYHCVRQPDVPRTLQ